MASKHVIAFTKLLVSNRDILYSIKSGGCSWIDWLLLLVARNKGRKVKPGRLTKDISLSLTKKNRHSPPSESTFQEKKEEKKCSLLHMDPFVPVISAESHFVGKFPIVDVVAH